MRVQPDIHSAVHLSFQASEDSLNVHDMTMNETIPSFFYFLGRGIVLDTVASLSSCKTQ